MIGNLWKKVPIAAAVLSSVTVFAGMDMDTRVTQLEHQMQEVRTENCMDTYGALTAVARPQPVDKCGCNDWFIFGGPIVEQARITGTQYAYTDNNRTAGDFPMKGSMREVDLDWDWGLTVGAGLGFDHDGWDLLVSFMWYDSSSSSSTNVGLNDQIVALRQTPQITVATLGSNMTTCHKATSNVEFDYSDLFLELGRSYYVSGKLSVRTFYAVEAAWVKFNQTTRYSGGTVLDVNTLKVEDTNKFWALGPRTGFDGKWCLGYGFSIYGDFDVSLLFAHFDVSHKETLSNDTVNSTLRLTSDMNHFLPKMHYEVGLQYDRYFAENKHHIGVMLGYDSSYLWNMNRMVYPSDATFHKYDERAEDGGLQGVKLTLRWDF